MSSEWGQQMRTDDLCFNSRQCRPIPVWAWIVGVLLFPAGMFIALAAARALSWWVAALYTIGSFGIFYMMATIAESEQDSSHSAAILAILWFYVAAGQFQYGIGFLHNLWTGRAKRTWKVLGWVTVVLAAVLSATHCVYLLLRAVFGF